MPTVWLLGSSDYSARLAASRGLPYVFAHHFAGQGTAEAIELYRSSYQPSEAHPEPRTFLTVNAAVAETAEEARRLALPQVLPMVALRTGAPLTAQRLVEEAEATTVPDRARAAWSRRCWSRWVVGEPAAAARRVEELATEFGVDEVMVHPVASALAGTAVGVPGPRGDAAAAGRSSRRRAPSRVPGMTNWEYQVAPIPLHNEA